MTNEVQATPPPRQQSPPSPQTAGRLHLPANVPQGLQGPDGEVPLALQVRSMSAARDMEQKAARNVAKWGLQDYETLGLAVAEEAGEIAQAVLQYIHEGQPEARIAEEALDLGALCIQVMDLYQRRQL